MISTVILLHTVNTKYAFPPLEFLHQVVCKIREKEFVLLGYSTERPSVTSGELNLALQHRVVEFACLAVQWSTPASDALLLCTLSTITETTAASMRWFYAHKWRVFGSLREADPVNGPSSVILSFLQEHLDVGHTSVLKMYVDTITAFMVKLGIIR